MLTTFTNGGTYHYTVIALEFHKCAPCGAEAGKKMEVNKVRV